MQVPVWVGEDARTGGLGQLAKGRGVRIVRIGLIGAGRIGRMHAELLARRIPGASLGMVYDVDTPVALADA